MNKIIFFAFIFLSFSAHAKSAVNTKAADEIISTINNVYLYSPDNLTIISHGLSALHEIDNNIVISKGSDRFYIYYNHSLARAVTFPDNNSDIKGWVKTLSQILESSTKISEKASLRDFELTDIVAKKMMEKLDKYSHYYSEFDYDETEGKNNIYTLFSDRIIDNVLYLRIRIFNKQTAKEIRQSLTDNPNIKGVILDLRGNSGGILNEALKTADLFTDSEIITYTAGKNNENIHYYTSHEGELYSGPLAIIVDGDTASAAEVLAAGLQEQSRAKIIGTQTFGKGTIQNIFQISNGSKLVLTAEQFFTPSGKVIHEHGVIPDICTAPDKKGSCPRSSRLNEDEDIEKAVQLFTDM